MYVSGPRHCYCLKGPILHCSRHASSLAIRRNKRCMFTRLIWNSISCLDKTRYGAYNISCPRRENSCFCGTFRYNFQHIYFDIYPADLTIVAKITTTPLTTTQTAAPETSTYRVQGLGRRRRQHCFCHNITTLMCTRRGSVLMIRKRADCPFSRVIWNSVTCLPNGYRTFNVTCPNLKNSCFCKDETTTLTSATSETDTTSLITFSSQGIFLEFLLNCQI